MNNNLPARTARFWTTFATGKPCKISLRAGHALQHQHLRVHDEGYTLTHVIWRHRGDAIEQHVTVNARDCDGRLATFTDFFCPLDRLHSREAFVGSGVPDLPAWDKESDRIYDYQAIAAGY